MKIFNQAMIHTPLCQLLGILPGNHVAWQQKPEGELVGRAIADGDRTMLTTLNSWKLVEFVSAVRRSLVAVLIHQLGRYCS
jgi:hypothetical protein